jgi:4-hydroxybenzoate polyprenyltransferase
MNRRVRRFGERVSTYGRMIRFSHTLFALPFALSAVVLAMRQVPVTFVSVFWIVMAMVGARSAAMGFNRIVDRHYDARNPRTADRELPSGVLSLRAARAFVVASAALFILSAACLGRICLILSVPVLVLLCGYSYTKRFTSLSHFWLGGAIALAPPGVWVALTGTLDGRVALLAAGLGLYIAGFDIIYACQDEGFDRRAGLLSLPARLGPRKALLLSALAHLGAFACLTLVHIAFDMGFMYLLSVLVIGGLLTAEHLLVRPDDLRHVHIAFFHINSWVSIVLLAGVAADEAMRCLG